MSQSIATLACRGTGQTRMGPEEASAEHAGVQRHRGPFLVLQESSLGLAAEWSPEWQPGQLQKSLGMGNGAKVLQQKGAWLSIVRRRLVSELGDQSPSGPLRRGCGLP